MGGKPSILAVEEATWTKNHALNYNETLRQEQLKLLPNFGNTLQTCFVVKKTVFGIEYQHWYVTDGTWVVEFGDGDISNNTLMVHCNKKAGGTIDETFELTDEVMTRMEKVCGTTNYSLALRNCEHVARYIQTGSWICMQMLGSGILREQFFNWMSTHTKQINTLPQELEPERPQAVTLYPEMPEMHSKLVCFEKSEASLTEADNEAFNVLFIGPTGSGKSTVINNLVNRTICLTGANAQSVTRQVRFYQCKALLETVRDGQFYKKMNIIDTLGFCDSKLSSTQVLDVIKSSVKVNVGYLDKVVVVCSGRIEGHHQDAIKQFLEWLKFERNQKKFIFLYNKSDGLTEAEKIDNLAYMCQTFGADTSSSIQWVTQRERQRINLNLALGFPPQANFDDVKNDHVKLTDAVLECSSIQDRLKVDESSCTIL